MGFFKEFKEFAMRGNVIDMAVGIIIGAAFGKVVSSLVGDVIMPPLGLLIGGVDFSSLAIVLQDPAAGAPGVALRYGAFLQALLDFLIVAFAIFVAIKAMNKLQRKKVEAPAAPPKPSNQEVLLGEIRDLLKRK